MSKPAQKKWFEIRNQTADEAEVMLYDDIGMWGCSAKDFAREFDAIKSKNITLRINSYGGEVFDGLAICATIKGHPANVTTRVDGVAASIASVIALAGDTVRMSKGSYMMIHNAAVFAAGDADELRKQAELLDKLSNGIAKTYSEKSGKTIEECKAKMDDETWFDAAEAKAFGLVDEVDESDDEDEEMMAAVAARVVLKYANKLPQPLRRIAAKYVDPKAPAAPNKENANQPSNQENKPMSTKIIARDNKHFVVVDGKEIEVEVPASQPASPVNKSSAAIASEAVAAERQYRADFNTALATANITGKKAEQFEKDFYGRDIKDVKFLASNAIAGRNQPVGEGGAPEPVPTDGGSSIDEKKVREQCAADFAKKPALRRLYRVNTNDPKSTEYKEGLEKMIAVELKCLADEAKPRNAKKDLDDEDREEDPITKIFKNKSVLYYVNEPASA